MIKNWWEDNCIKLVLCSLYFVFSVIYIIKLNRLNKMIRGKTYISIVLETPAVQYLLFAAILTGAGVLLLVFLHRKLWEATDKISAVITSFVLEIFTVIIIALIVYFIQNPILRAVFCTFIIGNFAIYAIND